MQGGKQNANETKGDGKTNPCKRMDVQKSRRFTQKTFPKAQKIPSKNRRGLNSPTAYPFKQYRRCVKCYQCIQLVSFMKTTAIL